MPRYFFQMLDGEERKDDPTGTDLPDDKAAWSEAIRAFGEMIAELDGNLAPDTKMEMSVSRGETIFVLCFTSRTGDSLMRS